MALRNQALARVGDRVPTPAQHAQELVSRAHLFAVVAKAGYNLSRPERDYGVDYVLHQVLEVDKPGPDPRKKRFCQAGPDISVQLKSSTDWSYVGDSIQYDLESKNWNDMARRELFEPIFLVLLCLPQNGDLWLECAETHTAIKHCSYWFTATGLAQVDNPSQKRVFIPRANLFTPESLDDLVRIARAGRGEAR